MPAAATKYQSIENAAHIARMKQEIADERAKLEGPGDDFLAYVLDDCGPDAAAYDRIIALEAEIKLVEAAERAERDYHPVHVPCGRCGGKGRLDCYRHVANGVCFACGGVGRVFG